MESDTLNTNRRWLFILPAALWLASGCSDGRAGQKGDSTVKPEKGAAAGSAPATKSDEEWKKTLTPQQYNVCRQKGTERPFTGPYWDEHGKGTYKCVACGNVLFRSDEKFDSGTGWPSFWAPAEKSGVKTEADESHGMVRNEVVRSKCGAHLGHVFDDGPQPTGLRYCINGTALKMEK